MDLIKFENLQGNLVSSRAKALTLENEWNNKKNADETYVAYQEALKVVKMEEEREEQYKQAIISEMLNNGITELVQGGIKLKLSNVGRDKVEIIDEVIIPEKFMRIKKKVDKIAVMKEYKETGVIEPGIDIIKNDSWKLTIKEV